jgi:hypothetical protein
MIDRKLVPVNSMESMPASIRILGDLTFMCATIKAQPYQNARKEFRSWTNRHESQPNMTEIKNAIKIFENLHKLKAFVSGAEVWLNHPSLCMTRLSKEQAEKGGLFNGELFGQLIINERERSRGSSSRT